MKLSLRLFVFLACLLTTSFAAQAEKQTINYNNVSMTEYLRFVSQITKRNFLFEESEVNFPVTVVSQDPVTPANVMATLLQILRIHGLSLLEQDGNLVIHKNAEVRQPAKIVVQGQKLDPSDPVVTKIFKIKETKAVAIAQIIKPMISEDAVLETFVDNNLVIVTDITANVEKISLLIEHLDSPKTSISIEPYRTKYNEPSFLIGLANQILSPLLGGSPFLLVEQPKAQKIFIVSTPALIEKTLAVLKNIDTKPGKKNKGIIDISQIFLYRAQNHSAAELKHSLMLITKSIEKSGYQEEGILQTIENVKALPDTNTLLFTGSTNSLNKIRELLSILDQPTSQEAQASSSFFLYQPEKATPEEIVEALHDVAHNMQKSHVGDEELINTLQSVRIVSSTQSLIFTGPASSFAKIKELLISVDIPGKQEGRGKPTFLLYSIKNIPARLLMQTLKETAQKLSSAGVKEKSLVEAISSMKYIQNSHSILFTSDEKTLKRVQNIVTSFDQPGFLDSKETQQRSQFFIYKPKNLSGEEIYHKLKDYEKKLASADLSDPSLLRTLQSMQINPSTNTLLFTGSKASLDKVEGLIQTIDLPPDQQPGQRTFIIYQVQYMPPKQVKDYLQKVAEDIHKKGIKDNGMIDAIHSMRWIPESHAYMFTGAPAALKRIQEMLKTFDTPLDKGFKESQPTFFVYQLQNVSKESLQKYLHQIANNLDRSESNQLNLYRAIQSMKWIEQSHSLMFSGTQGSLDRVKGLIATYDTLNQKDAPSSNTFMLYRLKHVSEKEMNEYLVKLYKNLEKSSSGETQLIQAINSKRWIEISNSFMFSGTKRSLEELKTLLNDFDQVNTGKVAGQTYFLYKLNNLSGEQIEEDLESFAKKMRSSGMENARVLQVIDNIKWIRETNSLLLTGEPDALEEVKALIAQYDTPRKAGSYRSDFFMYKPVHISAQKLQKSLLNLGESLRKGGLVDASLLGTIESVKYSKDTSSLIFTGSPKSLQKVEELIKEIDVVSENTVQHIGKTTFFLYKLKYTSGPQITKSLKNILKDLKKSGNADEQLILALSSMRFVKETNSLLFTGSAEALEKIKPLVEKFDIPSLGQSASNVAPSSFFVYKPVYVTGPDLEKALIDFSEHLQSSGLADQNLFHTIQSMRWVQKTRSLIFTGDQLSLDKVKELLQTFDVPGNGTPSAETSIQPIDNVSFLVYKLQYHKGSEIRTALTQIAKDLAETKNNISQKLLNSIQSIQWIQVTNSLLCTGDQETLTRLKELIRNLDVPLKQVFIEVLVIKTSLTNLLTLGLDWGSSFKYKDRFAGKMNNTGSFSETKFFEGFSNVNGTNPPAPSNIPDTKSFELGVIGDIITHKGRSFASLGSLMRALQTDVESTIVMTPKLLTQDGRTSSIFIGQNIPFVGSFVKNQGSTTVSTSNLEYRNIGSNLTITPVLGNSDVVTLEISIDNSSVVTDATGQSSDVSVTGVQGITTSKTTMDTSAHVPNGSFLILSGMVDVTKDRKTEGIPCLGGLPLIGSAFSFLNNSDSRANIVIFIRPHIISSYEDMQRITRDQEIFFQEQTGAPGLEDDFVNSVEFLKNPDYEE